MWIKQHPQHAWSAALYQRRRLRAALSLLALAALAIVMFGLGAYYHRQGALRGGRALLEKGVRAPVHYLQALGTRPERLVIDIKYTDYQRLAHNRQTALARRRLLPDARDVVPARIRHDGRTMRARVRLKGDLQEHWADERKWSFRIKLRGEDTLFGIREFSIQHPKTRGYLEEWFLQRMLADSGLIAQRFALVEVTVNGDDLGVYSLQEHFDKRLVEHNRRREAPLVRADTRFYWYRKPGLADAAFGAAWEAYQANRTRESPQLAGYLRAARSLLEAFREGARPTHEVFDVEQLARLFAILDLMGSDHPARLDNLVLYYNPITGRIEPAASDSGLAEASAVIGAGRGPGFDLASTAAEAPGSIWLDLLFADPIFFAAYVRELERIADPALLDDFFARHDEELRHNQRILHRTFPGYSFANTRRLLYRNQRFIGDYLTPVESLRAYLRAFSPEDRVLELELASIHALPVAVHGISVAGSPPIAPLEPLTLAPQGCCRPVTYRQARFRLPADVAWDGADIGALALHQGILGAAARQVGEVHPWPHREAALEDAPVRQPPNAETFPFVAIDPAARRIVLAPGEWRVDRTLILPPGYTVIGGPGTRLDLVDGASVISRSPLELRGTDEEPFWIGSSDASGKGLVVLRAAGRSRLEGVRFESLANPDHEAWTLTGAVTFYESAVTFSRCVLADSRAEDALNLIRTTFSIEDTVFERAGFDSLDVDFGDGRIHETAFLASGNDGLDVSGSVVTLEGVTFDGAGDKALSVGERSQVSGRDVEVRNAEVAVASKDLSTVDLTAVSIDHSRVGFTAYRKKPEFGSARITASGVVLGEVGIPYMIERGSTMVADGEAVEAAFDGVAERMYGAEFGKSSR